jgi:hypothetical protein
MATPQAYVNSYKYQQTLNDTDFNAFMSKHKLAIEQGWIPLLPPPRLDGSRPEFFRDNRQSDAGPYMCHYVCN